MNWVDYVVLAVLAASGLLAFIRGFVREVLGIGAWIGAGFVGLWALPHTLPYAKELIPSKDFAQLVEPAAFTAAFLVALLVLLVISHWIGALVRNSVLGGVDRSLGLIFGIGRGALLLVFAYVMAGWLVQVDRWPEPVRQARSLPVVARAAAWVGGLADLLPEKYRPHIPKLPEGKEASAAALLRANPLGRATGPQPARASTAAISGAVTSPPDAPPSGVPLGKSPRRE